MDTYLVDVKLGSTTVTEHVKASSLEAARAVVAQEYHPYEALCPMCGGDGESFTDDPFWGPGIPAACVCSRGYVRPAKAVALILEEFDWQQAWEAMWEHLGGIYEFDSGTS